jgi:ketosteroid isomerase-like protein
MDILDPVSVACAFIEAVNAGSVVRLGELMTEDHVFVDSDGAEYRGKSRMAPGWGEYLAMVPDYKIMVRETFAAGGKVMMTGEAEGTFVQDGLLKPENHWRVSAAWRAVVRDGKVAVWQLYVNPEPMEKILSRIRET